MNQESTPLRSAQGSRPIARVRRVVLARIAEASTTRHLTIAAGPLGWLPLRDGVRYKVLHEQCHAVSYLLQMDPGASLPVHQHLVDEECMVLNGTLRIGETLVIRAGDYHLGRASVLHAGISSPEGALVFLRGAGPDHLRFPRHC
jgi:anti-sigma factor ChrR (cupin superfamily)